MRGSKVTLYLAAVTAAAFAGTLLAIMATPRGWPPAFAWLAKATLVLSLVFAVTHFQLRRSNVRWREFGFEWRSLAAQSAKGALAGLLLAGAWLTAVWLIAPFTVERNPGMLASHFLAASLGTIAMGLAEEIGYRSYGLRAARQAWGYGIALLVTTGVFVAAHIAGGVPWQAGILVVGSTSLLLSVVMLETSLLPLVVSLHVATNLVQDNVLRTTATASVLISNPADPGVAPDPMSIWLAIAGINGIVTIGVWLRARNASRR